MQGPAPIARLLEHDAKDLLARHGVSVPRGSVVTDAAGAEAAAAAFGGQAVVKALVPANRRARGGGVVVADGPAAAGAAATRLLGSTVLAMPVERVLVEERLEVERELYLSFLLDDDRRLPIAVVSLAGGVDFEAAAGDASAVRVVELDPWGTDLPHRYRDAWGALGLSGGELVAVVDLTVRAAGAFFGSDATLLELNPIALAAGRAVALGALLAVDDLALGRHPELADLVAPAGDGWRPPTALELEAAAVAAVERHRGTARFIELEGDIGLLVGGGGGSLVFVDGVRRAGGKPACYTEIGGNPSAAKVQALTRVVLRCPGVRGLLVGHNVTNNTQVDLVARGVVAALAELELDPRSFPVVAREVGTNDAEGRAIFEAAGIEYLGAERTMDAAASRIVERVAEAAR